VKAFLIVTRNRVRDYLDVAGLSHETGIDATAAILKDIDIYYQDAARGLDAVASQIARQFADPRPADPRTLRNLSAYKNLIPRWQDWDNITGQCRQVALAMTAGGTASRPLRPRGNRPQHADPGRIRAKTRYVGATVVHLCQRRGRPVRGDAAPHRTTRAPND
jgi:hypothetical protein